MTEAVVAVLELEANIRYGYYARLGRIYLVGQSDGFAYIHAPTQFIKTACGVD